MNKYNLSKLKWELVGTKPHYWRLWEQMDEMCIKHPENSPVPALVPGSVQQSLLDAGIIPDWNIGTNYRDIEWIENRHWIYFTDIPDDYFDAGKIVRLHCNGLDDNGEVWLNGKKVGEFNNTHLDYNFNLSTALKITGNRLAIIFFSPERYQGQVYWTSKTRMNKPRFYYNWDWCPRILQIGICDDIILEIVDNLEFDQFYSHVDFYPTSGKGKLTIKTSYSTDTKYENVNLTLCDAAGKCILDKTTNADLLIVGIDFDVPEISPWFPNGEGEQTLYKLTCKLYSDKGAELQSIIRNIGFRSIDWLPCENAHPEADPWILNVNGKNLFMQGINWTPIRTMFADVTEDIYRKYLLKYKDLGANLLRVWGGATLEKECFYDICDELGLMVWQEFPLSSSGICNTPPDDDESVKLMGHIAESYIRRRHFHPSLIAWSGGNELYNKENTLPLTFLHPLLSRVKQIVETKDAGRRIMPSSPSGPTIYYNPELNGKSIQWDVHGPWWLPFEPIDDEMSNIREYWESSDALFHSEAGVPATSSAELIDRYRGKYPSLPISVENPIWGQFSWWIEVDKFKLKFGHEPKTIEEYVEWQQNRQTKALSIAIESTKHRFPRCGGFLIWMGHDCFPCTANTSIIDFNGNLKPVASEIKKIWKSSKD
jgi:beta-mannosidase